MTRDLNQEHADTDTRKYAYRFDYIHRRYMMRAISPFFQGTRALELGCYKGEFSKLILEHYSELTIVEGSSTLLADTQQVLVDQPDKKIDFHLSRFDEVNLSGTFDAVFLVHTLEHLDDPVGVLERIKTWLSSEGALYLIVPNANAASRQIAVSMGLIEHNQAVTAGEREHGHRKTYALDSLLQEVQEAGLKSTHHGGILFKGLANFQMDLALEHDIIDDAYFEGCFELGMRYPDLCASIFTICR